MNPYKAVSAGKWTYTKRFQLKNERIMLQLQLENEPNIKLFKPQV